MALPTRRRCLAATYASDPQLAENPSDYNRTYTRVPSLRIILAVDIDLYLTAFGFIASFGHVGDESAMVPLFYL
ncbi:hypothetical protein BDZ89DRAFT_1147461 [Hymenopellis radicata]|nr:hypothetical protein BDZ89DRAFT_1147461 [Hymenopellis radicata]